MSVSTPGVAGHNPELTSARWICRYSSRPGVAEMIFECGPFQWSIPVWRGWSVRIHSRMEVEKCFCTFACALDGDVLISLRLRLVRVVTVEELDGDGGELVV